MRTLVKRDFTVPASLEEAWNHLARVEQWPSWARHIKSATLQPSPVLSSTSQGLFILAGRVHSSFRMTEWDPPRRWVRWVRERLRHGFHLAWSPGPTIEACGDFFDLANRVVHPMFPS